MNKNETISCVNYNPRSEWERWTGSNKCPMCDGDEIEYNTQIVLTSYPAQAQLRCKSCGHHFSSGFKSECTDNDALNKLWKHDQSILGIPQVGDWPFTPTITDPMPGTDNWIPYSPTPNENNKVIMYGWVCPKCGAVLAPHVNSCPHCSPATTINITY